MDNGTVDQQQCNSGVEVAALKAQITDLQAEFERVQAALGDFYQDNNTRYFSPSDITPELLSKIPESDHFDIRVRIGTGPTGMYSTRLELVASILSTPRILNPHEWWSIFLSMSQLDIIQSKDGNITTGNINTTAMLLIQGQLCNEKECLIKFVEANPLLGGEAWKRLSATLDDTDTIAIDETNFVSEMVSLDVSSSAAWNDLDNVLSRAGRTLLPTPLGVLNRPYTKKDCLAKVVEVNPSSIEGWLAMGSCMAKDETISICGASFEAKNCFVKVLELDPWSSGGWFKLGADALYMDETIHVKDIIYDQKKCFMKAIEINPRDTKAWCNLGSLLESGGNSALGAPKKRNETVNVNGRPYTGRECCLQVLEIEPLSINAWFNLGNMLLSGGSVRFRGETYTAQKCLVRVVEIDPLLGDSWCLLGCSLLLGCISSHGGAMPPFHASSGSVAVNGTSYTELQCYVKAVQTTPRYTEAWFRLGFYLQRREETVYIDGTSYNVQSCFVRSLELDPLQSRPWCGVGQTISEDSFVSINGSEYTGNETVSISGTLYSEGECYLRAVQLGPKDGAMWYYLGTHLLNCNTTSTVVEQGGTATYTPKQCFIKALELQPMNHPASAGGWCDLGRSLGEERGRGASAKVNGTPYTARQCFVKAIEINPSYGDYWAHLGTHLYRSRSTISIRGKSFNAKECFVAALEADPESEDREHWEGLGHTLKAGETVAVEGRHYTKDQCYFMSLSD